MRLVCFLLVLVAAADQALKLGIQWFILETRGFRLYRGLSVTHALNPGRHLHSSGAYPADPL